MGPDNTPTPSTFCVCSFVGWYNVSAAAASASFFQPLVVGIQLALYLAGLALVVGGVVSGGGGQVRAPASEGAARF